MSRSILIADDEESTLLVLRETFERRGYRVAVATDGREALEVVRRRPFTLGIFDYQMPKLDGIDLLQRLREAHFRIPILLMSSETGVRDLAFAAGADGFFSKPIDVRDLREQVQRLIGEETALTIHTKMTITIRRS